MPKDMDKLPDVPGGYFLHCEGKDYPVKRGVATWLLNQKKAVYFAKREPNYYTVAENWRHAVPMSHKIEVKPPPAGLDAEAIADYWAEVPLFMPAAGDEQAANVSKFRGVRVTVPENPRYKRRSAPEMGESADEETVQRWVTRVYEWINAQAGDDAAKRISRGAVARLAREYGLGHLKRGFAALQRRENIENPAGWLVTYMRSEWKWSRKHRWG